MKQHQTSSNPVDATSNALRKVRSLDCVRPTLSVKPHAFRCPTTSSSSSIVPTDLKASRFSVQAYVLLQWSSYLLKTDLNIKPHFSHLWIFLLAKNINSHPL